MSSRAFWEKVEKCYHKWSDDVYRGGSCANEGCSWTELYCTKCGVYETHCQCGFENGRSGWSRRRWRMWDLRKLKE